MAQEMTLSVYLQQRGKKAKALTRIEAEVFGIPFPLLAGWPRRHGAMLITEEMIERIEALAAKVIQSKVRAVGRKAKQVTYGARYQNSSADLHDIKSGQQGVVALDLRYESPSFPGFKICTSKRSRTRSQR